MRKMLSSMVYSRKAIHSWDLLTSPTPSLATLPSVCTVCPDGMPVLCCHNAPALVFSHYICSAWLPFPTSLAFIYHLSLRYLLLELPSEPTTGLTISPCVPRPPCVLFLPAWWWCVCICLPLQPGTLWGQGPCFPLTGTHQMAPWK